ncbi:MAG: aminotransferase class III-fold pyridoxal phosphate-dependent enzyme [Rhodothermales bacterium]
MTTDAVFQLEDSFQIPTYNKLPLALARGEGRYVWDTDGNRYLDFYGGHCVTILGHCPPPVVEAVQRQVETLIFYSNVAYSPVRAHAAQRITSMAPEGLQHVFFCNSGTEANETAMKLARTVTGKSHIVAMETGFHGRTLGSLAATAKDAYRKPYQAVLADVSFVPLGDGDALANVLASRDDVAGVIMEPIQSMSGMYEADAAYYRAARDLCNQHGVLLIFDEVQTGVGRTGTFSISEQFGMTPDFITMAKSLASGIPIGAMLTTDAVASTVKPADQGTTFGGGMIAMAALDATLCTIADEGLMDRATAIHAEIREALAPHTVAIRGRGCLIGLEFDRPVKPIVTALRAHGVLTGGTGNPNVMRLMPPVNTSAAEVQEFLDAMHAVLAAEPIAS